MRAAHERSGFYMRFLRIYWRRARNAAAVSPSAEKLTRPEQPHHIQTIGNRDMITPRMKLASGLAGLTERDAAPWFSADDRTRTAAAEFEILRTAPGIVAETRVRGNFRHARETGLRRLRAYLRGNNSAAARLPMADTVVQCPEQPGLWRLQIPLPPGPEGRAVPRPRSRKVRCVMVGAETLAIVRPRWWQPWRGLSEAHLLSALRDSRWVPDGPCKFRIVTWSYLPWFICRGALAVPVRPRTAFA